MPNSKWGNTGASVAATPSLTDVVPGTSTSSAWGSITGTLSAQTDLMTKFALYALLTGATFTGALAGTSASFSGAVSMGALTATGASLYNASNAASILTIGNPTGGQSSLDFRPFMNASTWANPAQAQIRAIDSGSFGGRMIFATKQNGSMGAALTDALTIWENQTATFASSVAATTFSGSGSGITALGTSTSYQVGSFGVGTAASGTSGEIRATNNITAYYSSDIRLKENIINITNPIDKVMKLNGVSFDWTEDYIKQYGGEDGFFIRKKNLGLIAQEVEKVLPELVATREDGYLAIKQDNTGLIALLVEVVKNQELRIQQLEKLLG